MPRTSRLAVGGPAGETTDFDADYKFSPLERMLLTAAVCTEMPAPPTGRALLLGGGSAMSLVVQGGYRAECVRSNETTLTLTHQSSFWKSESGERRTMNERMRLGLDIVTDRRDIYIIIASRPVRWFITGSPTETAIHVATWKISSYGTWRDVPRGRSYIGRSYMHPDTHVHVPVTYDCRSPRDLRGAAVGRACGRASN